MTTTESSNAGATPRKPARKYTPRFTTERPSASRADGGGKGGEFWPTPRPFSPKRKMTNRFEDTIAIRGAKLQVLGLCVEFVGEVA